MARKSIRKKEIATPNVTARAHRSLLFGPPLLIEGEDAAAYDQLLARIQAAVKPVDIIDEMFTADIVSLEWEVLRWRRLKSSLIKARGLQALKDFLPGTLDYDLYSEYFADDLTEILRDNLTEDEVNFAQTLAQKYARGERDAVEYIDEGLGDDFDMVRVHRRARGRKAEELIEEYLQRESDAVTLVVQLLTRAGVSMDDLTADALAKKLDDIERIDRLTAITESRRNASLHEIDRRRAVLGQTLRRTVEEIEDGEFEVIETMPAEGKNLA